MIVSTTVGSCIDGAKGGAHFHLPRGISNDRYNNLYIADFINNRIRAVSADREVRTITGDGSYYYLDSTLAESTTCGPLGVAADSWGDLYFTDQVRRVDWMYSIVISSELKDVHRKSVGRRQ